MGKLLSTETQNFDENYRLMKICIYPSYIYGFSINRFLNIIKL